MTATTQRRARRRRRAEQQRTETALAITCPACGAEPGVWCGPKAKVDRWFGWPVEPWMHQRRYQASGRKP